MTLDEIDQTLQSWKARLRRVDENLVALDQDPTAQLLEGRDGHRPMLKGLTQQRVGPALLARGELFEQRVLLSDVLDRAEELRATVSRLWPSETVLAEIELLLRGKSIRLPSVQTPLAQRSLLTEAEREVRTSPEELLETMLRVFAAARDAVAEVSQAWTKLSPALEREQLELERLQALAGDLGQGAIAEGKAVHTQLESVKQLLASDPLGAAAALEGVAQVTTHLRGQLEQLAAIRDRAKAALPQAQALWRDLLTEHAAAAEVVARLPHEIEGAAPVQLVADEALETLSPWLHTLAARVSEGKWQTAEVGLRRFSEQVRGYLSHDRNARVAAAMPLQQREELLGRLSRQAGTGPSAVSARPPP